MTPLGSLPGANAGCPISRSFFGRCGIPQTSTIQPSRANRVGGAERIDWDRPTESEELDTSTRRVNTEVGGTRRIDWTGHTDFGGTWTGAPCSPQRTWAEKDGAKPLPLLLLSNPRPAQRTRDFSTPRTRVPHISRSLRDVGNSQTVTVQLSRSNRIPGSEPNSRVQDRKSWLT
jgi:hypothetical protein